MLNSFVEFVGAAKTQAANETNVCLALFNLVCSLVWVAVIFVAWYILVRLCFNFGVSFQCLCFGSGCGWFGGVLINCNLAWLCRNAVLFGCGWFFWANTFAGLQSQSTLVFTVRELFLQCVGVCVV